MCFVNTVWPNSKKVDAMGDMEERFTRNNYNSDDGPQSQGRGKS